MTPPSRSVIAKKPKINPAILKNSPNPSSSLSTPKLQLSTTATICKEGTNNQESIMEAVITYNTANSSSLPTSHPTYANSELENIPNPCTAINTSTENPHESRNNCMIHSPPDPSETQQAFIINLSQESSSVNNQREHELASEFSSFYEPPHNKTLSTATTFPSPNLRDMSPTQEESPTAYAPSYSQDSFVQETPMSVNIGLNREGHLTTDDEEEIEILSATQTHNAHPILAIPLQAMHITQWHGTPAPPNSSTHPL